ncbi:MAG TPA: YciI family protein [Candidatus Limnocylindria bacterium]|nr:YciI family protein [Candidatus Limnocylindria bacterium]
MAKFMLMFMDSDESWEKIPKAEQEKAYAAIFKWWDEHSKAGRIVGGEELQARRTAKTVRYADRTSGPAAVTDGPFTEAKESIGGYAIVEVKDIDEAVELAKTWPPRSTVEVRPLVAQR